MAWHSRQLITWYMVLLKLVFFKFIYLFTLFVVLPHLATRETAL